MSHQTRNRTVTIVNPQGLHARPAHAFVELAKTFASTIEIRKDHETVDGKSILSMLTLAAGQGTRLTVHARGPDAEQALSALAALVERGFGDQEADEQMQTDDKVGEDERVGMAPNQRGKAG